MKILLINKYLYPRGGDAVSTINTGKLLAKKGHNVFFWGLKHPSNPFYPYSDYFVDNIDYNEAMSIKQKISASFKIFYSVEAKRKIEKLINIVKPDIVHLNNFAHQISPSILYIFKKYGIPTVMTMHDYKLVCTSSAMFADGKPCERCKNYRYYWCLLKKCKKNSYFKSLVSTLELYLHHDILHLYELIDLYISPSIFLKEKIREMGFKGEVVYLPNFVNLEEFVPEFKFNNEICYFGRLSYKKGIDALIKAVKGINIVLKIIGTGPLIESLQLKVKNEEINNVRFLGYKMENELKNEVKKMMAVVVPSMWYENNPRTVLEAFALGKPVIGSRIGGIPELIKEGKTGYLFTPGDVKDLRSKILKFYEDEDKILEMGKNARKFVEEEFNSEIHYEKLMEIYSRVVRK